MLSSAFSSVAALRECNTKGSGDALTLMVDFTQFRPIFEWLTIESIPSHLFYAASPLQEYVLSGAELHVVSFPKLPKQLARRHEGKVSLAEVGVNVSGAQS